MGMYRAASPFLTRAVRASLALVSAIVAVAALGAVPAAANAGKVLVFTGTAGTPNPAASAAATAIQALGAANDFTVDTASGAAQVNSANLAGYRAVVFVDSSGDVLDAASESALQSYVESGGGFVGIGETALLEQGNAFFDTLIGLTGAARTSGTPTTSVQDVEFLDRVHPATRALPLLWKAHEDTWYAWTNNPTGLVHTVARVRFNTIPDGSSVASDGISHAALWTSNAQRPFLALQQPENDRALSWCRDVQQGRSFYTGLGGSSPSWSDSTLRAHLLGAIQWAAGMSRGNCKATINSNYVATRLTPPNTSTTSNGYIGEVDGVSIAKDGRMFYAGRAVCSQGQAQITNWASANVGLGCGTLHVWDPRTAGSGSENQDPAKVAKIGELQVFGAKGGGAETGATSKDEQGVLGIALDPDFTTGRPFIYIQYHPYFGGEQGYPVGSALGGATALGAGFVRPDYRGERRLSRFTYDEATKTLVPGSEKVIFHWMTQVYSCCHLGGSMDFDSKGDLYFATGDNTGNIPNANNGGYVNSDGTHTIPCPGGDPAVFLPVNTSGCGNPSNPSYPGCSETGVGAMARCGFTSYGDARQTSGNTNAYEGKLLRIKPLANPGSTPGLGTTYTIPGADAPNGPQLFPEDSQPVRDGKAKPEIFAMGTRNLYSIDIDPKTDKIATAWVGPDQGTDSTTYGPAKTEDAVIMSSAGNYGWPYCQGGNRINYRAKLPNPVGQGNGGAGANLSDNVRGTIGGGTDGLTGAYWDCSKSVANDSPFNTGLTDIPAPRPTNIWYGPQGGCYDYPRNANGVEVISASSNTTAAPATFRRCPWLLGGSQAPMTAGVYRKTSSNPSAWPAYWDGRWFLSDFASGTNLRHALLMDPATQDQGGAPVAVDALWGIIPTSIMGTNHTIDLDFGPDGALYIAKYSGSNFTISNTQTSLWKFAYIGGDDTPGPDPQASPAATSSLVSFGIGKSGGVSYKWAFDDGATADGASAAHSFLTGGSHKATLTVTYADGATAAKDVAFEVPPTVSTSVGGTVAPTLALTVGPSAGFGNFTPAVAKTYAATTTANVVSTGANAMLAVADTSTVAPGHLVNANGTSVLAQTLKARATNAANPNTAFADVSGSPLTLLTYPSEISNDAVALEFQQAIAANDPLRSGAYSKTLTFTLSTTAP